MNTFPKISCAVLILVISYSCKQANSSSESENSSLEMASSINSISSSSAKVKVDDNKKVIRTADLKMKVKDVIKSTYVIENVVDNFGGFVSFTDLKSTINHKEETRISQDSILETTKYSVENNIVIRVPNKQLDTILQSFRKEILFLDSRKIMQEDVSLQLLSNNMTKKRNSNSENRIEKAIDTKGKKLNQIIASEENLALKKKENDNKTLKNLSLIDKVNFSTITIIL